MAMAIRRRVSSYESIAPLNDGPVSHRHSGLLIPRPHAGRWEEDFRIGVCPACTVQPVQPCVCRCISFPTVPVQGRLLHCETITRWATVGVSTCCINAIISSSWWLFVVCWSSCTRHYILYLQDCTMVQHSTMPCWIDAVGETHNGSRARDPGTRNIYLLQHMCSGRSSGL